MIRPEVVGRVKEGWTLHWHTVDAVVLLMAEWGCLEERMLECRSCSSLSNEGEWLHNMLKAHKY